LIENVKSVILVLLVLLSLVQSYLLSYSSPQFEPINQNDYLPTEQFGTQLEPEEVVFPEQIILHSGDSRHTVLYPATVDFNVVLNSVKGMSFEGFRRINTEFSSAHWEEMRDRMPGIEIRFKDGLPQGILATVLQINGGQLLDDEPIWKIWIFKEETNGEVNVYFITESNRQVYEVQRSNISAKEFDSLVKRIDQLPSYQPAFRDFYVPDQPIVGESYRFPYTKYTADDLKKSLFVDPAITRSLKERDGSEIYTDGKRGLQIKNEQSWMSYSDPLNQVDNFRVDPKENLLSAVRFVNQHGGWNGKFMVYQSEQGSYLNNEGSQTLVFREYYQSYPVVNPDHVYYGYIKTLVQKGIVTNYERSVIVPDYDKVSKETGTLPGGEPLKQLLETAGKEGIVVSLYPAYRPEVTEDEVKLAFSWAVEYLDGNIIFFNARKGIPPKNGMAEQKHENGTGTEAESGNETGKDSGKGSGAESGNGSEKRKENGTEHGADPTPGNGNETGAVPESEQETGMETEADGTEPEPETEDETEPETPPGSETATGTERDSTAGAIEL